MYINKRIVQREIEIIPLLLSNLLPFTPSLEYNIERPIKERCQNKKNIVPTLECIFQAEL